MRDGAISLCKRFLSVRSIVLQLEGAIRPIRGNLLGYVCKPLKAKVLWSFKRLGTAHPLSQRHIPGEPTQTRRCEHLRARKSMQNL